MTNENLFDIDTPPASLVIVGGGAMALEMATAFAALGTRVDVVELEPRVLATEDERVSATIRAALEDRGVNVHTSTTIDRVDDAGGVVHLADGTRIDGLDKVLLAVGRRPRLDGLDLDAAGVRHDRRGVTSDSWGRTSVDGIWAIGDITGDTLTTHGANAVGRRAVRAIAMPRLPTTGAPRAMPMAVYSDPQVASVGLAPEQVAVLRAGGRRHYSIDLAAVDRGFTDDVRHGFVAVDVERFTGAILRAVVVGPAAAELIGMFTMAIDQGVGMRKLFGMIHPYPAYAQAVGQLADDFARETYPRLPFEWWAMARSRIGNRLGRASGRR